MPTSVMQLPVSWFSLLYISSHSVDMIGPRTFQHITGLWLVLGLAWPAGAQTTAQQLQVGVDLVTELSNDLLPGLLGSLAVLHPNVVIGPFGVASNLAMLLEASSGKTRQEVLGALNVTLDDIATLRVGFKAYCDLFLEHSGHPEPAGAFNSVALRSGFQMQSAFKNILGKHYCANITANASDGPALRLDSHAGVMAHWKDYEKLAVYTFLSHQALRPFTRRDGISTPVPMIPQVGVFKAGVWEKARAVLLPLETNIVDCLLLMPDDSSQINALAKSLNSRTIWRLIDSLQGEELEVFIPQLTTVSKQLDLTPLLRTSGINLAFDSKKADLTRASDKTRRTYLQGVTQDAYLSTSFTALNAVSGATSKLDLKPRRKRDASKLYVNKPFLLLVMHKDTRLVLVAGKVEDPAQVPT